MRIVLARGERVTSIRVRPLMATALVGLAAALGTLYLSATAYLVYRDTFVGASNERHLAIRAAYEDRIARLRAEIDSLNSQHLLAQRELEGELQRLVGRQAALDARQDVIANLSQAARRAGIVAKDEAPRPAEDNRAEAVEKAPPLRGAQLRGLPEVEREKAQQTAEIDAVETAADRLARRQSAYVDSIASVVDGRADRIAAVLTGLGIDGDALETPAEDGVGGPYVALADDPDADFRLTVETIGDEIERLSHLSALAGKVPVKRPIANAAITSRFGRRIDPFLGKPALHGGIDFRATSGQPVQATAEGVVIEAGRRGGYGNLVEIDHGNGLTTRFAHLSRISVSKGQKIRSGDVIGKVGSTGRSTGPHLHYEVRRDGKAIDPMPFVKAGQKIAGLLP